jgi:hypothetical protein
MGSEAERRQAANVLEKGLPNQEKSGKRSLPRDLFKVDFP